MLIECIKEVILDDGDIKCFTLNHIYKAYKDDEGIRAVDDTGTIHFLTGKYGKEDELDEDKKWFNKHFKTK